MDLSRMLDKCRRGQWSVDDLDFSKPPRPMSREDETAIVQYFVDMAGIERLAGALFAAQAKKVRDPTLVRILETFVVDEERHSQVALRLADYYDVHRYKRYDESPALTAFAPHFVAAVDYLSEDIASVYITAGELVLDVALLRSLNDFVDDEMSHAAMRLINRDESRHIAIDYHMAEYYASPAWLAELKRRPRPGPVHRARALWAFANVLRHARPFFQEVFFGPMDLVDPSGRRLREAFKRIQLLGTKPGVTQRPFTRFMRGVMLTYNKPLGRKLLGPLLVRLSGVDGAVLERLYDEADEARAAQMSFDEMARDALGAKYATP